jgi:hypothetical protein
MAVLIEIPLPHYQAFLGRCLFDSREYEILKNFVIDHVPSYLTDGNVTQCLCTIADARLLLEHAKRFYPVVASYIEEGIRNAETQTSAGSPNEYRKAAGGDTWHFHAGCSHWPAKDFVGTHEVPSEALCNECLVKAREATRPGSS